MSAWSNDQWNPMMQQQNVAPLMPPPFMSNVDSGLLPQPFVGPIAPDNFPNNGDKDIENVDMQSNEMNQNSNVLTSGRNREDDRDRRNDRKDRDRGSNQNNRSKRRSRSRDRGDRQHDSRNRNNRHDRRDRRSKWDNEPGNMIPPSGMTGMNMGMPGPQNMGMPGSQNLGMPGPQNMGMPGHQNMGMLPAGMPGPGLMPGQVQGPGMPGSSIMGTDGLPASGNHMVPGMMQFGNNMMMQQMDMMQNMPMMQNVMNPNMLMTQQLMLPNQPIFINNIILLPPTPGVSLPDRREKPKGCRTIFVGGLPSDLSENHISDIFSRFGEISHVMLHRQGVCHIRFEIPESVENAFMISGYRIKYQDQSDSEAITLFIDYALNREDQAEFERKEREPTPARVEPYTQANMNNVIEKVKSETDFAEVAPTLMAWLKMGYCNPSNVNIFYSLIQASNNQVRRLFNEKMQLDEEYANLKSTMREKFAKVLMQFEQVAKILAAASQQRVYNYFSKQQRRNIDMWLKMSEEVENIRDEFNANFNEDDIERVGKNSVPQEKYEELAAANEKLNYELEGYRNEVHLAKEEAERKFEKFKAQFIAMQALQNSNQNSNQKLMYPPLPPPLPPKQEVIPTQPPLPDDNTGPSLSHIEAKLVSILTAFLLVHPLGVTAEYLISYVQSLIPSVSQDRVNHVLNKFTSVFQKKVTGVGAKVEHRWSYLAFENIKRESYK